jgi:drug/metabolite transporter (DMT)-like permease
MVSILAGLTVLSWPSDAKFSGALSALYLLGACFCWAVDNNLTRKVSLCDATWIASLKGIAAGSVNLLLALSFGAKWPSFPQLAGSMLIGFFAYGVSLVLFVIGLRSLGAARTGAYYSVAPFIGALLSVVLLHELIAPRLFAAGALMALGLWLHLTERHSHKHSHICVEHEHMHEHASDVHHMHKHPYPVEACTLHKHYHCHEAITHTHDHYPDAHHQHG